MCGIFGYVGSKDPAAVCLNGLKFLEYRGYDSSGIAGVAEDSLLSCKETGNIDNLRSAVESLKKLRNAIAHTRWATHGKASKENAHPHFDELKRVAVVHNGIIENYLPVRKSLIDQGVKFESETDSEVIAQLIATQYEGNLATAVQKSLSSLQGVWALAIIHKDHPNQIIACSKELPLVVGINNSTQEVYISSDLHAFPDPMLDLFFLKDGEIAEITSFGITIFDPSFQAISRKPEKLTLESAHITKNGFEHFMLKEIFEQPFCLQQAISSRCNHQLGTAYFEELTIPLEVLASFKKILIIGCGTSWHAGSIATLWLEEHAKIQATAEIASELRHREFLLSEDTLTIAISQSGETFDTIGAVREVKAKGGKVLAICNAKHSTLTREADSSIFLKAGPEISVCSTKAFTSQLSVLALFTILMARLRGMEKKQGSEFLSEIEQLPSAVTEILSKASTFQALAIKYAKYEHFFFLGRNIMFQTALEAALKLKEISYIHAIGYPSGEMKHGPIALVDQNLPIIGLCGNVKTIDKMISNLMEVKSRGAPILVLAPISTPEIESIADDVVFLPKISDSLACITYSIGMQLFAYYIAKQRGASIDQPKNLAKSVTVE